MYVALVCALLITRPHSQSPGRGWVVKKSQFELDSGSIDSAQRLFCRLQNIGAIEPGLARARHGTDTSAIGVSLVDYGLGRILRLRTKDGTSMAYDVEKKYVKYYGVRRHSQPDAMRGYLDARDSIIAQYRHISEPQAKAIADSFLVELAGESIFHELTLVGRSHHADGYLFEYETPPHKTAFFHDGRSALVIVGPVTGTVVTYEGSLFPWHQPDFKPTVSQEQARAILHQFITDSAVTITGILGGELFSKDVDQRKRWVWQFYVGEPNQRMNRTVWIDAETGEILRTL